MFNENVQYDTASATQLPSIAWRNLCVEVNQLVGGWRWPLRKSKTILRGLTGSCEVGSLGGLLGTSGAGKTTLLDCLSGGGRMTASSEIYLGQSSVSSYYIRQHVQESIAGELSVGQILRYAFAFKNGAGTGREVMEQHIATVMAELMLPAELDSRPFAICSGGEQKRIAIAQELMALAPPTFLFIDEPTTGLDSASAHQVMLCLQQLAKRHSITVLASIHTPNDEVLQLFDQLYVLARGGVCIYSGPPANIRSTLETQICLKVPDKQPPIEALIKLACDGIHSHDVLKLATATSASLHARLQPQLSQLTLQPHGITTPHKAFTTSDLFTNLNRLFNLTFLAQWRNFLFLPIVLTAYFLTISTIFSFVKPNSTGCQYFDNVTFNESITIKDGCNPEEHLHFLDLVWQNDMYLSYVLIILSVLVILLSVIFYRPQVKIFTNEHRNYWYSISVFYLSSALTTLCELTLNAFLAALLSYVLSGQHAADGYTFNLTRFGFYFLFLWLLCLYYQAIGQLIGLIFVNYPTIAILFTQFIFAYLCLFNGLIVRLHRVGHDVFKIVGDLLGVHFISKGFFWSIYGFERCNEAIQYSTVLRDHQIDGERIGEYVARVLVNVVAVKLVTFAVMYGKFRRWNWKSVASKNAEELPNEQSINLEDLMKCNSEVSTISKVSLASKNDSKSAFQGQIAIAWRSLSLYSSESLFTLASNSNNLPQSAEKRSILHNLSGHLRFGSLAGLMGTSGAGKTSLLRVLNGQFKSRLASETQIYLSKLIRIRTCFITQDVADHLLPGLTARQSLVWASRLKNAQDGVDHEAIARKWLTELQLLETVDTRVEHCSGGERKRLAVALELTSLVMPNLICIDEPTSGLDSNSAEIVISTLRQLTLTHPVAIVTSIHQPTAEVLHLFDQLYVLARGGVCLFSGPPNAIQAHLDQLPVAGPTQCHFPIETLIKQSCFDHQHPTTEALVQLNSAQSAKVDITFQTTLSLDGVQPNRSRFTTHSVLNLAGRYLLYLRAYLWKEWTVFFIISNALILALRIIYPASIIHASGCISLEDDLCHQSERQLATKQGLIDTAAYVFFSTVIYLALVLVYAAVGFFRQFPYLLNEHRNGWYSTSVHYLVWSLFELLPLLLTNLLYIYLLNIFDPVLTFSAYWPLWSLLTLAEFAILGMGHTFALLGAGQLPRTLIITLATYFLLLLIGNIYLPYSQMPHFWQVLSNLSVPRFLLEAVKLLLYGFGRCSKQQQIQMVLYSLSLEDGDYWPNIGMLLGNLILFRLLALWLLVKRVKSS